MTGEDLTGDNLTGESTDRDDLTGDGLTGVSELPKSVILTGDANGCVVNGSTGRSTKGRIFSNASDASANTCSTHTYTPEGFSTRVISATALVGLVTVHSTRVVTTSAKSVIRVEGE